MYSSDRIVIRVMYKSGFCKRISRRKLWLRKSLHCIITTPDTLVLDAKTLVITLAALFTTSAKHYGTQCPTQLLLHLFLLAEVILLQVHQYRWKKMTAKTLKCCIPFLFSFFYPTYLNRISNLLVSDIHGHYDIIYKFILSGGLTTRPDLIVVPAGLRCFLFLCRKPVSVSTT